MILAAIIVLCSGVMVAWLIVLTFGPTLVATDHLWRTNYRGSQVSASAGVLLVTAVLIGVATLATLWSVTDWIVLPVSSHPTVSAGFVAMVGFCFVGLIDDLYGTQSAKGFKGHLRDLAKGRLTSGLFKIGAGVAVSAISCSWLPLTGWWFVAGVLTVAAWANVGNLFDLGPGRCLKVTVPALVVLVGFFPQQLMPMAFVAGVAVLLLVGDLRERLMLGDNGSNPIGAAVGLSAVACGNNSVLVVALCSAISLNVFAEFISFSRIIEANSILRKLDSLGVLPQRRDFLERNAI